MQFKFILFICLNLASMARADVLNPYWVSAQDYESGLSLCNPNSETTLTEDGQFIQVPLDYENPAKGTTPIYYHFANGFDPAKPSVVVFDGGPGQTSHSGILTFDFGFNVIFFDQRGIACSRPDSYVTYRNLQFYSSEKTARDADEIRRHLGIAQWSVYGVSYGTAPATIYANLFAQYTKAVVLEGVVFSGQDALWSAPHRRKILQRLLRSLPAAAQKQVSEFAQIHKLAPSWLSLLARSILSNDDGVAKLREVLINLAGPAGEELADGIRQSLNPNDDDGQMPIFESDSTVYGMIACRELALMHPQASPYDELVGLQLVSPANTMAAKYCEPLGVKEEKLYSALAYPLRVPVTYFQGGDDGSTDSPFAIQHYKKVALGQAQLLISPRGGHTPNMNMIYEGSKLQLQIFELALKGQLVPADLLQQLKKQENHFWAFTSK